MYGCGKIASSSPDDEPLLIGVQENDVITRPLMKCGGYSTDTGADQIRRLRQVAKELRGVGFTEAYETLKVMLRTLPSAAASDQKQLRIAVLHGGE